jgi:hypothetical protein
VHRADTERLNKPLSTLLINLLDDPKQEFNRVRTIFGACHDRQVERADELKQAELQLGVVLELPPEVA